MRKIGLTLLTLTIALAACGEAPTAASAVDARAAMDGGFLGGSGSYYEEGGPGFLGSGHVTVPDSDAAATEENPGFLGSGYATVPVGEES
ncbi:MAG TPA: hypothetical protein VFY65_04060, partial [Longimicrobium sp.]|nr:hypothetical protein [Longimicrobium sp.]